MEPYFPFNVTFKYYVKLYANEEIANEFVKNRNQEFGGHWVLHSAQEFNESAHPIQPLTEAWLNG